MIRHTAGRFTSGTAGNLRSSKGLDMASQKAHPHPCPLASHKSTKGIPSSDKKIRHSPHVAIVILQPIAQFDMLAYMSPDRNRIIVVPAKSPVSEPGEDLSVSLKKDLEKRGVTRKHCEAKLAKLKKVIESRWGSSQNDRKALKIYEGWLNMITMGERKDLNAGGRFW